MKKILVLFKTHLDVGFTDLAANVIKKYNEQYIPKSIAVAKEISDMGIKEGFTWTTGSWLVEQYLEYANEAETEMLEEAIRNKWIRWHGLPFTLHSETADKPLFEYGLSIAKKLDAKYGVNSIGSKMTDVPGHTKAIIPLLKKAGIEFLHLGENPAAFAPDVPVFFRWKADSGEMINVMYNSGDYGEFTVIPTTETGVYFAHTGDNLGPTSTQGVLDVYRELHEKYPEAEIHAADLNDLALEIRKVENYLPVITAEIGDSWINGSATDPKKTSMYRALLRFARECDEASRNELYKYLIMIPEHTWGVDVKTWLGDHENYSREHLEAVRNQPNFQYIAQSWVEQRAYVFAAIENISNPEVKAKAQELVEEVQAPYPRFTNLMEFTGETTLAGVTFKWDSEGITSLVRDGKELLSPEHKIGTFLYEAFSERDVEGYGDRYLKRRMRYVDWVTDDYTKMGLGKDMPHHYHTIGNIKRAYGDGQKLYLVYTIDPSAYTKYGCPKNVVLTIRPENDKIVFDFIWTDKHATRVPEALWLGFNFNKPLTGIQKLGSFINPLEVLSGGNRETHATEGTLKFSDEITLESKDALLLAVEKPSIYAYYNQLPDTSKGVWMCLFADQWATNFPQWYDDDARFRFELKF